MDDETARVIADEVLHQLVMHKDKYPEAYSHIVREMDISDEEIAEAHKFLEA